MHALNSNRHIELRELDSLSSLLSPMSSLDAYGGLALRYLATSSKSFDFRRAAKIMEKRVGPAQVHMYDAMLDGPNEPLVSGSKLI